MFKTVFIILVFHEISTAGNKWNDTMYEMPSLFELDSYDSCIKSSGKYCLAKFELFTERRDSDLMTLIHKYSADTYKHFNHTVIERGICVTRSCKSYIDNKDLNKQEDLKAILEACQNATVWNEHGLQTRILEVYYCKTREIKPQVDAWDWITVALLIAILLMNIVGSLYDIVRKRSVQKNENTIDDKYLLCFSLTKNWNDFVTIKDLDETHHRLNMCNFAKVITSTIFIFGHIIMMMSGTYIDNTIDKELEYEYAPNYIIFNGAMQVQVFFVVSAFLHSFLLEEKVKKKQYRKGTLLRNLLVNRLGRLTPVYMVVMLSCCSWIRFLRSGPLWHEQDLFTSQCRKYFWMHLLYINNYATEESFCCQHTWYLAADFQLFLLTTILFVATMNHPWVRNCILVVIFITSVGVTATQMYLQDLDPVLIMNPETIRYSFKKSVAFHGFYKWTYNHVPSYVMAFIYGYIARKWIEQKRQFNYKICYLDWLLIPAVLVILMLGMMFYSEKEPGIFWFRLIYGAGHKIALSGIFGLMGLCVLYGPDERFRKFMTWDGLVLPTRLSYCVYLVHMLVIHVIANARTQQIHYSFFDMFMTFCGVIVVTYLIAVPLHLMVEAPFSKAVKLWTSNRDDDTKKDH